MSINLRFDFPPEVNAERNIVYSKIQDLLAEQTLSSLERARRMHLDWLQRYPDDYYALDAGEMLAMTEEAYLQPQDTLDIQKPALTR